MKAVKSRQKSATTATLTDPQEEENGEDRSMMKKTKEAVGLDEMGEWVSSVKPSRTQRNGTLTDTPQ